MAFNLSSALKHAAIAAPIVMTSFSNAVAAPCLEKYEPSVGVTEKQCYTTQGINDAMKALGQTTKAFGNRSTLRESNNGEKIVAGHKATLWTSNADNSYGITVEANAPLGQQASEFHIKSIDRNIQWYDARIPVTGVNFLNPAINDYVKAGASGKFGLVMTAQNGSTVTLVSAKMDPAGNAKDNFATVAVAGASGKPVGLGNFDNFGYTKAGEAELEKAAAARASESRVAQNGTSNAFSIK